MSTNMTTGQEDQRVELGENEMYGAKLVNGKQVSFPFALQLLFTVAT